MKKLLLIVLALTGLAANGQYFHHIYGTTDGEKLSDGINTNVLGLGHFLVGHAGQNGLAVSRTDINGNVPAAPYFDGWYQIWSTVTGAVVSVNESRAFELDNGLGFGIIGQYQDVNIPSPNSGVFYLQLDPAGNVLNIFTYIPVGGGVAVDVVNVAGLYESIFTAGNDVFVSGTTTDGASRLDPFAMMLDVNSGALIWSGIYDLAQPSGIPGINFGRDIICSPYSPAGIKEVVLVGSTIDVGGGTPFDGFTLRLDANTGAPITGAADIYGTPTSSEEFNSIAIANSGAGGSNGFVLGGYTEMNGSSDFWLMKTDQTLITLWASAFDYNGNPGATNVCNDVMERLNTSGNYEYYSAGYVINGVLGNYDMVIVKTDDFGVGVGLGEFTYGDARLDYGIAIDQYNGTGSDGISFFGFREGAAPPIINGNYDMYLVKSYFNGETPCNQKIMDVPTMVGPKIYTNFPANHVDKLMNYTNFAWNVASANDFTVCYRTAIASGSNARIAPVQEKGDKQAIISPNPIQAGSNAIEVTIESEAATTANVAIYDMLGREYYNGTVNLAKGTNTMPIDISNTNMSAGTYSVRINFNNTNKTILLMVK